MFINDFYVELCMDYKLTTSADGTRKIDFAEGHTAVIIPTMNEKYAVCVSCQIGCPVGCKFCYTGKMGLKRNLTADEIVNQIVVAKSIINKDPTTVVFMGMGEPLLNLNAVLIAAERMHKEFQLAYNHITISTSCLPAINKLLDIPFNVALSIHSPFDEVRRKLMPPTISIKEIVAFAQEYCKRHPRKEIMIEYALMKGINDRDEDSKALLSLSWPRKTLFNFIQYNDLDQFKRSVDSRLRDFKKAAIDTGFKSFIRLSRGQDIEAACGMLDQPEVKFLSTASK
jgi:23S rRNA (adenine2503-C2)-methyltransferase